MQERTTTADAANGVKPMSLTAEPTESQPEQINMANRLYLRMTPEILAELAFQQVNLLASRLSLSQQVDFYERLQKYIDLSHISSIENSI